MAFSDGTRSRLGVACAALLLGACASAPRVAPTPDALAPLSLRAGDGGAQSVGALLAQSRATAFVFWSATCPCVRRYQQRVEALAAQVAPQGVAVVGISSNADETLAQVAAVRTERGVSLPVLRDDGGHLARALGARSTPTVVLVRADGAVLFHGWLDNERLPGEPGRVAYLEDAIAAFAAGRAGPAQSRTFGCAITQSLGGEIPTCHAPDVVSDATPSKETP